MTLTNNRVTLKLFFGCLLTPDIEMRLKQSLNWKKSRINSDGDIQALTETYFQEKKYLGFFLDQPSASLSDFRLAEKEIRDSLAYYCSDLPIENLKLFIFSQIFIT
jgi:hypothetical protein